MDDLTTPKLEIRFTEDDLAHLYTRHTSRAEIPPWTTTDLSIAEQAAHLDLLLRWTDFLNHSYTWHPVQLIPPCWPLHPGLERELTTLYWAYYEAFETPHSSASAAQVWHDRYLPGLHTRLTTWTTLECRTGNHQPRPTSDLLRQHTVDPTRGRTSDALRTALTQKPTSPAVPLPPPDYRDPGADLSGAQW